jgi:hypothetical protein
MAAAKGREMKDETFKSEHGAAPSDPALPLGRRHALALLASGMAAATAGPSFAAVRAARPMLATPEQLDAERTLLRLLSDADLVHLQNRIRMRLASTAIGRTRSGAISLDRAIAQWTNSLILAEISTWRDRPVFIWGTDDTPRRWFGYELGGVGTSGDNPDAIYRTAMIDGSKNYEVTGRIPRRNGPTQLVFEVDKADLTRPSSMMDMVDGKPAMVSVTLALLTDKQLALGPDGRFRVTLGPDDGGTGHIKLKPGRITVGTRDMLSNWYQRPSDLAIREVGAPPGISTAASYETIRGHVLDDLSGFVDFWAHFPEIWFGGLKPNTISQPQGRHGGWGFVAGLRFDLEDDEAMLVTLSPEHAPYTGFQINDPWMIAPDARYFQVCLNNSQTTLNRDGTCTYAIAKTDPGVANWLDTTGLDRGIGILRWQGTLPDTDATKLIREIRVVKLADLAKMGDIPRVTPAQRRRAIAARLPAYSARTRVS